MGVAQWADVPAFVPVGAIRPRLGRASSGILGEGQAGQAWKRV